METTNPITPSSSSPEALWYPSEWGQTPTALCHDWLTGMRGGERCLELLCDGFPQAEICTLISNPESVSEAIRSHSIRSSYLNRFPGIEKHYRNLLPLFPNAIGRMAPPADVKMLVSTSHCVAKSLRTHPETTHFSYCFTPMRYAWLFHEEYFGKKAKYLKPLLTRLQDWDRRTAERVDHFIAISHHVRERIETFYGREADVVYPPVDTGYFQPNGHPSENFDLVISALVPYKRVDLAVEAYNRTGRPLKVVGSGGEFDKLRTMAKPNVEILGRLRDEEVRGMYQRCRFLLFPGEEDFGIVPLEAMACGRPVIAYAKGGALETVADQVSGVFFGEQSSESMIEGIEQAESISWDPVRVREQSLKFSQQTFISGLDRVFRQSSIF